MPPSDPSGHLPFEREAVGVRKPAVQKNQFRGRIHRNNYDLRSPVFFSQSFTSASADFTREPKMA